MVFKIKGISLLLKVCILGVLTDPNYLMELYYLSHQRFIYENDFICLSGYFAVVGASPEHQPHYVLFAGRGDDCAQPGRFG